MATIKKISNTRNKSKKVKEIPGIPLRDLIVFPHMVVPLLVGRTRSINAVEEALAGDSNIVVVFQKDVQVEKPGMEDLYPLGVLAKVIQSVKENNGVMKILVEVLPRVKLKYISEEKKYFCCGIEEIAEKDTRDKEEEALMRFVLDLLEQYVNLNSSIPNELYSTVSPIESPNRLCDTVAGYLPLKTKDKARILNAISVKERLKALTDILNNEIAVLEVQKKIQSKVVKKIEDNQKQYFLNEQLKEIQKELGRDSENPEVVELQKRIEKAGMPESAEKKAMEELKRLSKTMSVSPEANVIRTYLEWMVSLPWENATTDNLNVKHAERILNEDHYGLEKVKERIIEYLAVKSRKGSLKGQIICFVGPPGVGKTSLGKSIARAMDRKFVRISLGGIKDEAEIRGHRRTYIGSMPGRVIQSVSKAGVKNPVFLLDEIDKLGNDFRGDPASALLEVLDPEQHKSFSDHYLEVDYDLSNIFFITTANNEYAIPQPLLDRMEIIPLPGYTMWEKVEIAKQFLVPKQIKEHGLKKSNLRFSDEALIKIIRHYTREAGVRNLERVIASVCRKVTRKIVENSREGRYSITPNNLEKYLGRQKYAMSLAEKRDQIGTATGMAWTEYGGDILFTEALLMEGKGNLLLTGQLGEVMKESAQAALSYVRSNASALGIKPDFYKDIDIHVHVPEGAIPKDGPSAGVTVVTAIVSALTRKRVNAYVAMTGEITLRGKVLKIGGLKSKILAAHRSGIRKVIIPAENEKDLEEIPGKIKGELQVVTVDNIDEVLANSIVGFNKKGISKKT